MLLALSREQFSLGRNKRNINWSQLRTLRQVSWDTCCIAMPSRKFGSRSTGDDVLAGIDLSGQLAVITGLHKPGCIRCRLHWSAMSICDRSHPTELKSVNSHPVKVTQ